MQDQFSTQNISKAIADLHTIKASLENRERIYPGPIWNFFLIGGAIALGSLINFFVVELHGDLLRSAIFVWTPLMITTLIVVSASIWYHVRHGLAVWTFTMKNFQISRVIMAPSVVTLGLVLYTYGFELGTIVLLAAAANISIFTLALPRITLLIPAILTIIAWAQMAISAGGPLLGLVDGLIIAVSICSIGIIVGLDRGREKQA